MRLSYAKKIEVIRAMFDNAAKIAQSMRDNGEEDTMLYNHIIDEVINLDAVLRILESDASAKRYANVYNVDI